MGKIINLLLALITYVCVATVITLMICLGYLWHTDQLNNEKLFRIMALVQDVDLQQISEAQQKSPDEVPPEEQSLNQVMHRQLVQDRNYEVKLLALQRGRQEWDRKLQELREQSARQDRLVQEFQSKVNQQAQQSTQENVVKVVNQLEQVKPEVGKELLMRWIAEGRMDDTIVLMSKMSERTLSKILKTFETPDDLNKLHEIHERILSGAGSGTATLEKAMNELGAIKSGT
jgi:hypothetical protein